MTQYDIEQYLAAIAILVERYDVAPGDPMEVMSDLEKAIQKRAVDSSKHRN